MMRCGIYTIIVIKNFIFFKFRCKEVDWIPFITTKTIDNISSHIRLYRQARKMKWAKSMKDKQGEESSSNQAQHQIEQTFFELEYAASGNKKCHKMMCMDPKYEKGIFYVYFSIYFAVKIIIVFLKQKV